MSGHTNLYREIEAKAQREGRPVWPPRQHWDTLKELVDTGVLTEQSYASLAWGMANFYDAYPYRSADGRAYVWAGDRRWTAEEWNAECAAPRMGAPRAG